MLRVIILFAFIFVILFSTRFVDRAIGRRMTGIGKIALFVILTIIGFVILRYLR